MGGGRGGGDGGGERLLLSSFGSDLFFNLFNLFMKVMSSPGGLAAFLMRSLATSFLPSSRSKQKNNDWILSIKCWNVLKNKLKWILLSYINFLNWVKLLPKAGIINSSCVT